MERVGQVLIPGVAVPDDGADVAGQHSRGVDAGGGSAAGVHAAEVLGAGYVHVLQAARGAG
jgi:hypothetical protein